MSETELKKALRVIQDQGKANKKLLAAVEKLLKKLQSPGDKAVIREAPVPSGQIPEGEPEEFGESSAETSNFP